MAHDISRPIGRDWQAKPALRTVSGPPIPLLPPGSLPDAFDARYPRRWWLRALRFVFGLWWLPLAVYLVQALTSLATHAIAHGLRSLASVPLVLAALRLRWALGLAAERPVGLVLLVAGGVALLAALMGGWRLGRWARADRVREAQVLVLRLARPEERTNPAWMRRALLPAMEWRLRQHRTRRRLATLALLALALAGGVALALKFVPAGM